MDIEVIIQSIKYSLEPVVFLEINSTSDKQFVSLKIGDKSHIFDLKELKDALSKFPTI